jgi:hypothetical protein
MNLDAKLHQLASRQYALVTIAQARRLGLSDRMIATRTRRGSLDRISRFVLRVPGSPRTPQQEVLAAVWSSGPTAVASHTTAAWLWSLEGVTLPTDRPHVTVARPATGDRRLAIVHQTTVSLGRDRASVQRIPATGIARTLIELGAVAPVQVVEAALDGALRDGLVSRRQLLRKLANAHRPGRSGVGVVASLLVDRANGAPESWLERTTLELFLAAGLPTPQCQRVFDGDDGRVTRVDFSFADGAVIAEVSGHRTHSTRRQRQADAERRNRLLLQGIAVWEYTYEDVIERPEWVVGTTRRALDQAGVIGDPPSRSA